MPAEPIALELVAAALPRELEPRLAGGVAEVTDVHHDSRAVTPGSLFVAIPGAVVDGRRFVPAAVAAGAAGVIVQEPIDTALPQVVVNDARAALGPAAAAVYRQPAEAFRVVGVTGTNGKTTVTHMIEAIVHAAGGTAGVVGTVGAHIAGEAVPVARTTPEADDLQRLFARMRAAGVNIAAIEVSSHALELRRVDGVVFDVAVFTNLSQDHLDFHGSMERYFAAKAALFTATRSRRGVVWIDDPAGARLAEESAVPVITVGSRGDADVVVEIGDHALGRVTFSISLGSGNRTVRLPLSGRFNVANAALAAVAATEAGVELDAAVAGLEALPPVPGRFEVIAWGGPFSVIVDYAHSPDAVSSVIGEVAAAASGRVITVIGAGGDRDRGKRPAMGAAAARGDVVIVTSDNPRSEDPEAIADAVAAGIPPGSADVRRELDRRAAIDQAVMMAEPGDVVLILGKGHETGQEQAGVVTPFDDRLVASEALDRLGMRSEASS